MDQTIPPLEIPKPKLEISDDIIEELNIQCKGYIAAGYSRARAQKLAMNALVRYGSLFVKRVPITDEMVAVEDYGFRLKETK